MATQYYKDPQTGAWVKLKGCINVIQSGGSNTTGIPAYIVEEAERVVSSIQSKKGSNAITFIAMSDMHEMGDNDHTSASIIEQYRKANLNAGQAAKLISDKLSLDFFANLGDFAWGTATTTVADGVRSIRQAREYIADVVRDNESFITPGNHDILTYGYDNYHEYLSAGVAEGLIGTYRYKDFDAKKVRVICLNTADMNGASVTAKVAAERLSGAQLQWFAQALDLSGKENPADWGIIILSHHPLDWGEITPAANCLAAYLDGSSYSVTHNGVAVSYNYSGKNAAKVIACFHGHVHNFKVDYVHDLRSGKAVATTVKRLAIPNACFGRNNEYATNGGTENNGIEFGEFDKAGNKVFWDKTDKSGKSTAFCVVSIDLDNEVIYADCYGAGCDRIESYGSGKVITYSVTNDLNNATNSNGATIVREGSAYNATITAKTNYKLASVTVTMGGVDITATAVSGGKISIGSVTGDIVITATTSEDVEFAEFTNLVPTLESVDSTAPFNGIGYLNGAYISEKTTGTDAACVATGLLPYAHANGVRTPIYIRGAALDLTNSHVRIYGFGASKGTAFQSSIAIEAQKIANNFQIEELGTNYYKIIPNDDLCGTYVHYLRFSLVGKGDNLIITLNEPILK
jgi:hypothetical protein